MDADVIIAGAGLIGLALARELHRRGLRVLICEAGPAARQASWAGAGMLAARQTSDPLLRPLAIASARLYPTWAAELQRETGLDIGYRPSGTLFLASPGHPAPQPTLEGWELLPREQVKALEPALALNGFAIWRIAADHSVDNRALAAALLASVRARGVRLLEHTPVEAVAAVPGGLVVQTRQGPLVAPIVVNAAGAWADAFAAPVSAPVRPRKGQMLALHTSLPLHHVITAEGIYVVPRAAGRVLVGATLEDVGFAAGVEIATVQQLRRRAVALLPRLASAEVEETWAGFRPCSGDERPILGPTSCPGYWLATAHFRDGILLTPITAKIIASAIITGHLTRALDLKPFLPRRFAA